MTVHLLLAKDMATGDGMGHLGFRVTVWYNIPSKRRM
jgi:hypothetical protein